MAQFFIWVLRPILRNFLDQERKGIRRFFRLEARQGRGEAMKSHLSKNAIPQPLGLTQIFGFGWKMRGGNLTNFRK